ncbi:MAG: sigma-E processing peptidase SpoIIGA, partial [Clostridia bacterium]|nr:sigma-E processing peptidase SpoIIGA [Clostridia bacterium]
MTIYIDVLFFINLISDFLILSLCDNSFSKKSVVKRICASCIGSLYACLFVFNIN